MKDRHAQIERKCEYCGQPFFARVERVNKGQGRFCSIQCAGKQQSKNAFGFTKGRKFWDGKRWTIHWHDEAGTHVTSYTSWWWRINRGEVPDGYCISFKDGNPKNIKPSNFECITKKEARAKGGKKQVGIPKPWFAKEKSKWWRGGSSSKGYPNEFCKPLKKRIKIRDNYTCQACNSAYPSPQLDVHHIDQDTKNNNEINLVTLCRSCHSAVHGKSQKSNTKIRYYQSLLSN